MDRGGVQGELLNEASMPKKPVRGRQSPRSRQSLSSQKHDFTDDLYGWITRTDLASRDPAATRKWCAQVLGWTFKPPFSSPGGDVHLFAYSDKGGGAVRAINPPEVPGSIPYVHVRDATAAYEAALEAGAEEMMSPTRVMEGVTIAIVRAPGGVPIGFSGP